MSMINKHSYFMDSSDNNNNDVVDIMASKGYLPNDKYLPKTSLVKSAGESKNTFKIPLTTHIFKY